MNRSFVLRAGRFTAAQRRSYSEFAKKFVIPADAPPCFQSVFGNDAPVTAEIGFGMGTSTAQIAAANPDKNYLGIEVHRPGIGRLLWEIESRGLSNIRIVEGDAADFMQKMLAPSSLQAIHIFFPDPWPKKKHHKRRLLRRPFTEVLAQRLVPGGYLYMTTDWEDYALEALAELAATPGLCNAYDGFAEPQPWRPATEFERKGLNKSHIIRELFFTKA